MKNNKQKYILPEIKVVSIDLNNEIVLQASGYDPFGIMGFENPEDWYNKK